MKYPIIRGFRDEFKKSLGDALTQIKLLDLPEDKTHFIQPAVRLMLF